MRFSFVHAADLHLDSPLLASQTDPRLRAIFDEATFRAFERVVDTCLARRAAFLVLAGDLFETRDRSVRARLRLRDQLQRLLSAGVRAFVVHGNHDPLSGDTGTLALPSNVKVFGTEWEEAVVKLEGRVACRVQGVSYPSERVEENLALRFSRKGSEFTVGVLHANVGRQGSHADYAPASWEDLDAAGLDYWALGHVHTRMERALPSGGLAVYPGNAQGRHANETGPRGCVVVEVEEGRARTEFVAVDSVRWHTVAVDASGYAELGGLEDAIEDAVVEACSATAATAPLKISSQEGRFSGPEAYAVRLVLGGRTALHGELIRAGDREALEQRLREILARRSCPVMLEGLVDDTEPLLDLEALRAQGGLYGALFDQAEGADLSALFRENGLEQLEKALRRVGLPPARDRAASLLARSARQALELLAEGEG